MKKLLAVLLAVVMICSLGAVSVSAESDGFSQMTLKKLEEHEDTEVLPVWIELYTGVKVMQRWEYFWRNGINMSRFEYDEKYKDEAYGNYMEYTTQTEGEAVEILKDFFYNELGISDDTMTAFNGSVSIISTQLSVADIKRLKSFDKVLGVYLIRTFGNDASFNARPVEFAEESYNTEYLGSTADVLTPVQFYGRDGLHLLFRGGQVKSREKSEEIIDGFLIIGSEYTHSDDNPTGLFSVTESGVVRSIREGFELGLLHMDLVAMNLPYVYVIGDADYDMRITVKDATMIQKLVAGIKDYEDVVCVSRPEDKDRDGRVTIKDATAIQKEIAGLSP